MNKNTLNMYIIHHYIPNNHSEIKEDTSTYTYTYTCIYTSIHLYMYRQDPIVRLMEA